MKTETKNAQLSKEAAQEMINSGIESLRLLAVTTFPELDNYTNIKTWTDVVKKLGLSDCLEVSHPAVKLEYIFEAVRGTKQAVFSGDDYQYFLWWDMLKNRFDSSSYDDSNSFVSARMCCPEKDMVLHIVKYFEAECKEYFIRK